MRDEFKFVGLIKPTKTITCETNNQETFRPDTSNLTEERFDALFKLMKNNWGNAKALIEHEGLKNGLPINPVFIEITQI